MDTFELKKPQRTTKQNTQNLQTKIYPQIA